MHFFRESGNSFETNFQTVCLLIKHVEFIYHFSHLVGTKTQEKITECASFPSTHRLGLQAIENTSPEKNPGSVFFLKDKIVNWWILTWERQKKKTI